MQKAGRHIINSSSSNNGPTWPPPCWTPPLRRMTLSRRFLDQIRVTSCPLRPAMPPLGKRGSFLVDLFIGSSPLAAGDSVKAGTVTQLVYRGKGVGDSWPAVPDK